MATAGVLPGRLGRVGRTAVPVTAGAAVMAVTAGLVLLGDIARVAALTDAAVLTSFILVNLSLPWLAWRSSSGSRGSRRAVDIVVPALAVLLCGWLLLHTGWLSLAIAGAIALVGLAVARQASVATAAP